MAKVTDPDQLTSAVAPGAGENVIYDTTAKTIKLNAGGNLVAQDGITFQALYSRCMDDWKNIEALRTYPFPFEPIGIGEMYDMIEGWDLADAATRNMIRDGGYARRATKGATNSYEEWACFVTLGDFDDPANDLAYWIQSAGGATTNANYAGPVNQMVRIWRDDNADGVADEDYRSTANAFYKAFLRQQGKTYDEYDLVAKQSLSTLTYRVYKLPLSNRPDPKIVASDNTIDTSAPYTGMSITWLKGSGFQPWANNTVYSANSVVSDGGRWYFTALGGTSNGTGVADDTGVTDWTAYSGERNIGGTYYAFNIIVDGNATSNGTVEQIYEFVQRQLRKTTNINAGTGTGQTDGTSKTGNVTPLILSFLGDTLYTKTGVYVDNFANADINNIVFTDVSGTERSFPAVAPVTITFSSALQNDTAAWYHLYFTNDDAGDNTGRDWGTPNAITVQDNNGTPVKGTVGGAASFGFSYDWTNNTQRGAGSGGTSVPFTCVAGGKGGAQYTITQITMTSSAGITIGLVAAQDRAYKT